MNVVSRGIRNAFRNTIRTGSIIIILSLSIGLVIAMLAARQAVQDKITSVKESTGNTISVSPAGVRGFEGGGNPLTETDLASVSSLAHVSKVVKTLNDRLTSSDTSLKSGIEPGSLGNRNAGNSGVGFEMPQGESRRDTNSTSGDSDNTTQRTFTMPVTITGINDESAIAESGATSITWKSGKLFDTGTDKAVAAIGTAIATKNNLSVGSTFTAYDTTFTVTGIYDSGNTFNNDGVYVPLSTLQRLSDQSGAVTSATVTVDSSDNLASVTSAIKTKLGDAADVTNAADTADAITTPLQSVSSIALFSLIGALIAGAVIILLTMLMIVRERRREVGVMKAIGASNFTIMWQFVVEATTLTVIALVVGTGFGVLAATPITNALVQNGTSSAQTTSTSQTGREMPGGEGGRGGFAGGVRNFGQTSQKTISNLSASVGASTLLEGVGAALLIAILGSALPSLMISKIRPADAMRNE